MPETAAKPPSLLIIDDDAEIRYSLTRVFSSRGYHVAEAASGEQGLGLGHGVRQGHGLAFRNRR